MLVLRNGRGCWRAWFSILQPSQHLLAICSLSQHLNEVAARTYLALDGTNLLCILCFSASKQPGGRTDEAPLDGRSLATVTFRQGKHVYGLGSRLRVEESGASLQNSGQPLASRACAMSWGFLGSNVVQIAGLVM